MFCFHPVLLSLSLTVFIISNGLLGCLVTEYNRLLPNGYSTYKLKEEERPTTSIDFKTSDSPERLFQDYWLWVMKVFPQTATFYGNHDNDDKLDSHTIEDFQKQKEFYQMFLERARNLFPFVTDSEDKLNMRIFIWEMESTLIGEEIKDYHFIINNQKGPQLYYEDLIDSQKLDNLDDYQKYLKRLQAMPKQIYEDIELMRMGLQEGRTFHNLSMNEVPEQISLLLERPEETLFYQPFDKLPDSISSDLGQNLRSLAVRIIREIQAAFKSLQDFITQEYYRGLRHQVGIHSIPGGKEFYNFCLRKYTSTNMTAEQIHELGLREVARIDKIMQNIIHELGYNDSLSEFSRKLRYDPRFIFKSKEEKLETARHNIYEVINPVLLKLFWEKPKLKLLVESIPEVNSQGPAAYYIEGNYETSGPGRVFFNTKYYKDFPKYDLLTDCMHEGNPGHHYQNSYFSHKKGIPMFRKFGIGGFIDAYREGWALYAEYLGLELGLFSDPYNRYGHFSWENFRASRLVVDTGIHYYGWSKEQAVEFLFQHTAASKREIDQEVDRYITDPGQSSGLRLALKCLVIEKDFSEYYCNRKTPPHQIACGYKIGETKIRTLRKEAEAALGSRFDVRDFHTAVLDCGHAPLDILDICIDEYIREKST